MKYLQKNSKKFTGFSADTFLPYSWPINSEFRWTNFYTFLKSCINVIASLKSLSKDHWISPYYHYATLHLLFTLTPYTRSNTSLYSSNLSFLLNMLMFMVKFGISLGKKIYDKHKFSCIRINTFFYYPHV